MKDPPLKVGFHVEVWGLEKERRNRKYSFTVKKLPLVGEANLE